MNVKLKKKLTKMTKNTDDQFAHHCPSEWKYDSGFQKARTDKG